MVELNHNVVSFNSDTLIKGDHGVVVAVFCTKKGSSGAKCVLKNGTTTSGTTEFSIFGEIEGNKFLFLDLDVIIHQDLKYFFDLPMDKPYIVRGWWNDTSTVKRNFSKHKSTPLNSSVIRWDRGQLNDVWNQINANPEVIFFTYPSLDNYLNHKWYNIWDEDMGFFRGFPKGDIYSWYKGNTFPDDMEKRKTREDHKICLFNNSTFNEGINDEEIKKLW